MAKKPPNSGKPWSDEDIQRLRKEAKQNTPTRVLALHLGRSEDAVYAKAREERVSLKPTNQSPYGTKKSK